MNKKNYIYLFFSACFIICFLGYNCSSPSKQPERPELASVSDTNVFAADSIRFSVETVFAPAKISGYLWSMDCGKTYPETTDVGFINKSWAIKDSGIHCIVVKVFDSRNIFSDSIKFNVTVIACRPDISIITDTFINFDSNSRSYMYIVNNSECRHILEYVWSFDSGATFPDTTPDSTIKKQWTLNDTGKTFHIVSRAIVLPGFLSEPAQTNIHINYCRPVIILSGDSVSYTGDSTRIKATLTQTCSSILWYMWSFDSAHVFWDTAKTDYVIKYWNISDTGIHTIIAKVQTSIGVVSNPDSFSIKVLAGFPHVSLPADTSIYTNDTIKITANINSSQRPTAYFTWTSDLASQEIMTADNFMSLCWPANKAGAHLITVAAVDNKGFLSNRDSMTVTTVTVLPVIKVPHDTLIKRNDTLEADIIASVAGGKIVKYLWSVGSIRWTDSGATPKLKVWYNGKDTVSVMVGARDNRGALTTDSFHVYFNSPPENLSMHSPRLSDTVIFRLTDSTYSRGSIPFRFLATDKNGSKDTLTYKLYIGKNASSLAKVYEGTDTIWTSSTPLDTAVYYWKLTAKDRIGDSISTTGSFICLLQHTICFNGHSIVAGFGGDNASGGFRTKVLSTLRERMGGKVKVKPVGPATTGLMSEIADDSCLAVASYKAKDIWLLMKNAFASLNADSWVVMLGVNGGYTIDGNEFFSLISIIDNIHTRNPKAATYVINALPYKNSASPDTLFNRKLADSISVRKKRDSTWNIWDIDAFKAFAINDTTNPALFDTTGFGSGTKLLHPNQAGYDTLAKILLDTMQISFPAKLHKRP
jgi:hypothetical protein